MFRSDLGMRIGLFLSIEFTTTVHSIGLWIYVSGDERGRERAAARDREDSRRLPARARHERGRRARVRARGLFLKQKNVRSERSVTLKA